eukprot:m.261170 g.261170  ORF g.261170 m.261170 type:complete len:369 (-) comp26660_c1_seq2:695-1801(-)
MRQTFTRTEPYRRPTSKSTSSNVLVVLVVSVRACVCWGVGCTAQCTTLGCSLSLLQMDGRTWDELQHPLGAERDAVHAAVLTHNPTFELVLAVRVRVEFGPAVEHRDFMVSAPIGGGQHTENTPCSLRNCVHGSISASKPILPFVDAQPDLVVKELGTDRLDAIVVRVDHQHSLGVAGKAIEVVVPCKCTTEVFILAILRHAMSAGVDIAGIPNCRHSICRRVDLQDRVGVIGKPIDHCTISVGCSAVPLPPPFRKLVSDDTALPGLGNDLQHTPCCVRNAIDGTRCRFDTAIPLLSTLERTPDQCDLARSRVDLQNVLCVARYTVDKPVVSKVSAVPEPIPLHLWQVPTECAHLLRGRVDPKYRRCV